LEQYIGKRVGITIQQQHIGDSRLRRVLVLAAGSYCIGPISRKYEGRTTNRNDASRPNREAKKTSRESLRFLFNSQSSTLGQISPSIRLPRGLAKDDLHLSGLCPLVKVS
jgi:hypothetical protein